MRLHKTAELLWFTNKHMKQFGVLLLTALSTGAFAQAPVEDVNSQSLASGSSSTQVLTTFELEQRLAVLERIVDSRTESQQRMQRQLDLLQSDVDSLRGSVELHTHQLEKVLERQRELYLKIEQSLQSLQQQTDEVADQMVAGGTGTVATGDVQEAYENAVNLILKQKDYDAAVPAFEDFLRRYPESEFTANAHYWLGQLLYNKQDYPNARTQFLQVVDKFRDSPKRADSMLKLGMLAMQSGDNASARQYFQRVISEYPDSTSARLAQQQL